MSKYLSKQNVRLQWWILQNSVSGETICVQCDKINTYSATQINDILYPVNLWQSNQGVYVANEMELLIR